MRPAPSRSPPRPQDSSSSPVQAVRLTLGNTAASARQGAATSLVTTGAVVATTVSGGTTAAVCHRSSRGRRKRRVAETLVARCHANRGRRIARDTVVRLVAAAGGHCERPLCQTGFLWHELADGSAVRLGEVAHIVAASAEGPRGDAQADDDDLVAYTNLMLLCPTCHTIVDGAPDEYTADILRGWKIEHESRVTGILGVARYESRDQARQHLVRLLEENRVVWERYGPESPEAWRPETAVTWSTEVKDVILPNSTRIERLLEVNAHLLRPDEERTAAEFSAHSRALAQRHLAGVVNPAASRFPAALNTVFSA